MKGSLDVKENPLAIRYIKILKIFLAPIGAWPGEALGERVPYIFVFHRRFTRVQAVWVVLGQVIYLYVFNENMSFFLKGQCYISLFLTISVSVRNYLLYFEKYGEITKEFLMSFHLIHYKDKGEYYKKIYMRFEKISHYFNIFGLLMMLSALVFFNLSPIYQNFKTGVYTGNRRENSTVEFSVYYTFTGYDPANQFLLITIYNLYLSYNCAVWISAVDCFLSIIVFQIIGHIQILRNTLTEFPKPKKRITLRVSGGIETEIVDVVAEYFDAKENLLIHKMLVKFINYHKMVAGFTQQLSDYFGPMFAANYLLQLLSGCLLLLEVSRGDTDAVLRFGPLTLIIFGQLIQISVVFEVVGVMSEKLKNTVYYLPWECMDERNRRTVYIILNKVQEPIRVTAMGSIPVGVTTMAQILKTTFSYFTILSSMKE